MVKSKMKRMVFRIMFALLILTIGISFDVLAAEMQTGTLIGYVYDSGMNPIQGARVRVFFHETYEEDYTSPSGYYLVTNIPLCYCLKNATASKEGYITEWVQLSIGEATAHDFVLTPVDRVPTWIVDDDGPADFQTIQEAINNAMDWDTVYVRSGVYYENVVVNKTVSLVGENRDTTIVEGNRTGTVLKITQNNVSVTGLTIRGSGSTPNVDAGVCLENVGYCTISGNRVLENEFGISLTGSYRNAISENLAMENYGWGIHLEYSSNHNTLVENLIIENRGGIDIHFSSHFNTIVQNRIANGTYGMILNNADSNSISQNFMSHLELGICLQAETDYNLVFDNTITDCSDGTELRQARNNTFYHNTFNNSQQVVISTGGYTNFWDDDYPSGGNYWSDYAGTDLHSGPYQNITGSDGIGDTPYAIDDNNIDHYPLMVPWTSELLKTDLNDDGVVNILDISIIAIAFGSTPEGPNWNIIADLNNDQIINILDISTVAMEFGKTV